jgi:hypothetical protein
MLILSIKNFTWDKKINMLFTSIPQLQVPKDTDFETSFIITGSFVEKYGHDPKRVKFNHHKTLYDQYEYIVDSSWGDDFTVDGNTLMVSIKKK